MEQFALLFALNALKKGINPYVLSPAMGKLWERLRSSALFRQPVQEKENSEFKPAVRHLKIVFNQD